MSLRSTSRRCSLLVAVCSFAAARVQGAPSDPAARARHVVERLPIAQRAMRELRLAAQNLGEAPLRAAVQAQLLQPWLPSDAFALEHPTEAAAALVAAHLLEPGQKLPVSPARVGSYATAPGGPCPAGHHAYPGGLAVHSWANLLHARGLAATYRTVYGLVANDDYLVTAAIWHDVGKVSTLPWRADGSCGTEPLLAGTPAHHAIGIAAAILRHLPPELIVTIASAHQPPSPDHFAQLCGFLDAGSILAVGHPGAVPCPSATSARRPPVEGFITYSADTDYALTGAANLWYAEHAPAGWQRFEAMIQDGSDVTRWLGPSTEAGSTRTPGAPVDVNPRP